MSKVFPIKVEKLYPHNYKFIEWKLHNVCNYNCSFCGINNKDGSQRWFGIDTYKQYIDKLNTICSDIPTWIQITGGEPTLFPKFIDLIEYIKEKKFYISLISNGARSLRWWEQLRDTKAIDKLFLSYHTEQTSNYNHIAKVANLFHNEPTSVICLVTHTIDTIELSFEASDYLVENTGSSVCLKAMNITNYDIYSLYNETQLTKLKSPIQVGKLKGKKLSAIPKEHNLNHLLKMTFNDGSSEEITSQLIQKNKQNNFYGWSCDVGKHSMRIDKDVIYRGVCETGVAKNLKDFDLSFSYDEVICDKKICFCGTDLIATKTKVV